MAGRQCISSMHPYVRIAFCFVGTTISSFCSQNPRMNFLPQENKQIMRKIELLIVRCGRLEQSVAPRLHLLSKQTNM